MQEKGVKLSEEVYDKLCKALADDYQCVREAALTLIKVCSSEIFKDLFYFTSGIYFVTAFLTNTIKSL